MAPSLVYRATFTATVPVAVGVALFFLARWLTFDPVRKLTASLPFNDPLFATPAFLAGRMYVRTAEELYCIVANGNG
jgi:hypothetical protein